MLVPVCCSGFVKINLRQKMSLKPNHIEFQKEIAPPPPTMAVEYIAPKVYLALKTAQHLLVR